MTSAIHAIVPLTILEAIQHLDAPTQDGLEEFHRELAVKRLGMSETVAAQIERFRRLADRGRRVESEEVAALFRLAGRRNDAGLVFADAGRHAGRRAIRSAAGTGALALRGVPGFARNGLGFAIARRALRVFDATLDRSEGLTSATIPDPPSALATPRAVGCGFYGSAIAEILRDLTDFDGAMFHVKCRSKGDAECRWSAREA
ncbi:MAG: hypothetical protein HY700_18735 [Gemmatimonadetes bacterium]|nr:hypothetical protein [Gemmatimonadota bacterium]